GTLVIEGLERWSLEAQGTLAHRLTTRTRASVRPSVRFVVTSRVSEDRLRREGRLHPALASSWSNRVIDLPPLRARPDDLEPLVDVMLLRAQRPEVELDASTWRALASHSWTDNVRELRRVIETALVHARGDRIEPTHLILDPLAPP